MQKDKLVQYAVVSAFVLFLAIGGFLGYKEIRKAFNDDERKKTSNSQEINSSDSSGTVAGEPQTYTHPDYGFTLKYPAGFTLGKFAEGEGEVVLVQGKNAPSTGSGQGGEGFQIFISPYTEEEKFSKEVILKADPKMKIENEKNISFGSEEINALVFDSSNEASKTHEVWFVADGNLYQCTSFKQFGEEMERILGSLRFN